MKNLIVIGGGTAGWLTALFCKKHFKGSSVTLIESKKVNTVGAGEGTSIDFPMLLEYLDISEKDFLDNTNGTIKKAIRFDKWNDSGKVFYNGFWNESYDHAFHFDSTSIIKYFVKLASIRKIKHIIGDVTEIIGDNNISKIVLEDGQQFQPDFVFDCTGFSRLIIGNHFKEEWISSTNILEANSAIPFSLPTTKLVEKDVTNALRRKHGWIWNIPLKHRLGCGYVFNDNKVDADTIRKEIREMYGEDIELPRKINFKAGYYKNVWKGNCMAVGLSNSFFEPLLATSISVTSGQLTLIRKLGLDFAKRDEFNSAIRGFIEQIECFIEFHYHNKAPKSSNLKKVISKFKNDFITSEYLVNLFKVPSHLLMFDREAYNRALADFNILKKDVI
jgi:hypothetical protein